MQKMIPKYYKILYDKDYFSGKKSFFYKFGYKDFPKIWKKKLDILLKYKKKGKVLEIGCGFGFFLKLLRRYFEVYGFDVSEYAIKVAKKIVPSAHLKVYNAEDYFPYPTHSFDVIVCIDVLEHLKFLQRLIKNSYIYLKKDGILFLSTPNYNIIRKTLYYLPDKLEHHISMLPMQLLIRKIKDSGFKIEKILTYGCILDKEFWFDNTYGPQSLVICRKK